MTKPMNKIKKLWEDKTGVSPIIAVILMVAITVVLAATIYVWVSGFGAGGGGGFTMAVSQIGTSDGEWANFTITSVNGNASAANLQVTVDGTAVSYGDSGNYWHFKGDTSPGSISKDYAEAGDVIVIHNDTDATLPALNQKQLSITNTAQGNVVVQKTIS